MTGPRVQPGPVIQNPGFGGIAAEGIQGILGALMQQQQMQQQAQQQALQQELLRAQLDDMRRRRQAEESAVLADSERASAYGSAIQQLTAPGKQVTIPGIGIGMDQQIQTPQASLAQVLGGMQPGMVPGFLETGQKVVEARKPKLEKLGKDDRLVDPTTRQTVVGAAPQEMQASDNTGDFRDFLATNRLKPNTSPDTLTPEQVDEWKRFLQRRDLARAPKTTFNMGTSVSAALAPEIAKRVGAKADAAAAAKADLAAITTLRGLLDEGINTGVTADLRTKLGNALVTLGWSDDPTVANSEAYKAVVGQRVGQIIKQFGAGTGLSDADRAYAERIAGDPGKTTEQGLRRLLGIAEKASHNLIAEGNRAAKTVPEEYRDLYTTDTAGPGGSVRAQVNQDGSVIVDGKAYKPQTDASGVRFITLPDGRKMRVGS